MTVRSCLKAKPKTKMELRYEAGVMGAQEVTV